MPGATAEYSLRCEQFLLRVLLVLASRHRGSGETTELQQRLAGVNAALEDFGQSRSESRMARLASALNLSPAQVDFYWAVVAVSGDPRIAAHAEALGGPVVRRGLTVALYADVVEADGPAGQDLTAWITAGENPLVQNGLLSIGGEKTTPTLAPFAVSNRVLRYLCGDENAANGVVLRLPEEEPQFDEAQGVALKALAKAINGCRDNAIVVVEGPAGSGRKAAICAALAQSVVVLDAHGADPKKALDELLSLKCEALLSDAVPVVANAEDWLLDDDLRGPVGRFLHSWGRPLVVTSSVEELHLGTAATCIRVRWPVPGEGTRGTLWKRFASGSERPLTGDVNALAHRYRIGPGGIARAVDSAKALRGPDVALDTSDLVTGLRHNIAERMGNLAHRVEVSQTLDDLVLSDDSWEQVNALIARVKHAPQVLGDWQYQTKMARGTGVPVLFSGVPGTGKSMCAGILARELELELYQVDLSGVVS